MKAYIFTRLFLLVLLIFFLGCSNSDNKAPAGGTNQEENPQLVEKEFILNGGFEKPLINTGEWTFISSNNTAAWIVEWADIPGSIGNLEIQNNVAGIGGAYEGEQHTELDSHSEGTITTTNNNVRIFQDIEPCPGPVKIKYAWRPRSQIGIVIESSLEVYWDGGQIGIHSGMEGDWILETVDKTVAEGDGVIRLEFVEVGIGDSLGMFLDAVSVVGLTGCN